MSDTKTAEQLAGEVKGVLDARFGEVKSSLEAKQAELRGVLDARHNEIKSDLEAKHDKVKALAEEALGKAQRGEDLSNATKELADEALTALNEAKARLTETDRWDNKWLSKQRAINKIDAAVALCMAVGAAMAGDTSGSIDDWLKSLA